LLTQFDHGLRRAKCDQAIAKSRELSAWERELIEYVRHDQTIPSQALEELSMTRPQQSRLHLAVAMKNLLLGNTLEATESLQKCKQCHALLDYHWAEAFLRRLESDPDWPGKEFEE
jgi:hypothetical protein